MALTLYFAPCSRETFRPISIRLAFSSDNTTTLRETTKYVRSRESATRQGPGSSFFFQLIRSVRYFIFLLLTFACNLTTRASRFKHAWLETWIIGSDELYYTARFEMGVFRDPPHRHRMAQVPMTAEEQARGMRIKLAYDWRPPHRVLLHYRFLICEQERSGWSVLEAVGTSPENYPITGLAIDPVEQREEVWHASFHHRIGTCSSSRSSLRTHLYPIGVFVIY
jgi:hypothetical protein